jgi:hypothetical protein
MIVETIFVTHQTFTLLYTRRMEAGIAAAALGASLVALTSISGRMRYTAYGRRQCIFYAVNFTVNVLNTVLQDDSTASAELQNCLDAICEWSNEWQLKLAPAKCIVMRIRSGHSFKCSPSYHIAANSLQVITSCTDLGVSNDDRLSFSPHLSKIVVKASQRAKLILKCFRSRDSQLLMHAFCAFVRSLLEFSSVIWSPCTIADLNRRESVQQSFTKAIQNLSFRTYKERLINPCVDSLQCTRIKANLVFCYKILHNLVDVNSNKLFTLFQNTNLRCNKFKFVKPKSVSVRDSNFSFNRVVNIWNSLPDSIVTAESVYSFNCRLNSFDFSNFIIL